MYVGDHDGGVECQPRHQVTRMWGREGKKQRWRGFEFRLVAPSAAGSGAEDPKDDTGNRRDNNGGTELNDLNPDGSRRSNGEGGSGTQP